ncbi:hypothetical protein C0992_002961 [Termitomyces sp. T32_za158]|nr:hypothetical protein C0992_002961 [Termitomyces sp. T32_za158]
MGLNLRKWFRKSKKVVDPHYRESESVGVAMSELAASLRGEIQGLIVEIKQLKRERESLFRDIHDIMLSKCQGGPPIGESSPPPSLPLLNRKRSAQTLWIPTTPTPPASEDDMTYEGQMGLFGPRSRVPSIIDPLSPALTPDQKGLNFANFASGSASHLSSPPSVRQPPFRSMSEASHSSNNSDAPTTPTRTAWRVVEKKPTPVYVARTEPPAIEVS